MFWYDDEDAHNPLQLRMINNKYTLQERVCVCVWQYIVYQMYIVHLMRHTHSSSENYLHSFLWWIIGKMNTQFSSTLWMW